MAQRRSTKRKSFDALSSISARTADIEAEANVLKAESEVLFERRAVLSQKVLDHGRALMTPLLEQIKDGGRNDPHKAQFKKPIDMFELAIDLEPENTEAEEELEKMRDVLEVPEEEPRPTPNHDDPYDVIIVGAGASGVGMGLMLTKVFNLDPQRVLLIERGEKVGESFRRWPREMRFISPSFNNQGWTDSFDLNSVAYGTSPAYTLQTEHPTGEEYASYLHELSHQGELNVRVRTEVTALRPRRRGGFTVEVVPVIVGDVRGSTQPTVTILRSRYVIWAAGEFQYPKASAPLFPGSELCRHNSSIESWKMLPGDDFVIIGGYESGMDAVSNLVSSGKHCTLISSTAYWRVTTDDPSTELSPYTMERIRQAFTMSTPPRMLAPLRVFKVEKGEHDSKGYVVHARWEASIKHPGGKHRAQLPDAIETGRKGKKIKFHTGQPPVLCTGFVGSAALGIAKDLFEWDDTGEGCMAGAPLLNEFDESTLTPGLFLVGPAVRHDDLVFCFVYKFRQRFGVVADSIARGLGYDTTEAVEVCRGVNMFLDDFTCCKGACGETC